MAFGVKTRRSETKNTDQKDQENQKTECCNSKKGFVLTDIDLPFGRVLWLSFQFFVAGLILAIPIWLIIFLIVS
tara:strand:- start:6072 stop:6293 length:222 start_codon:yes stop_codon:yes gene_type:complete